MKRRGKILLFVDGVKEEDGLCCDEEGIYPYDWIISLVYWKEEVFSFLLFVGDGIWKYGGKDVVNMEEYLVGSIYLKSKSI